MYGGGFKLLSLNYNYMQQLLYKYNPAQINYPVYIKSKRMSFGLTQVKLLYPYINKPILLRLLYVSIQNYTYFFIVKK